MASCVMNCKIACIDPFMDCFFRCRYGVKRAKYKQTVQGKTPMIELMALLKVTTWEASRFIRLFEKIDEDHSGSIDIYEFFDFYDIDASLFAVRAFNLFDFDKRAEEMTAASSEGVRAEKKRSKKRAPPSNPHTYQKRDKAKKGGGNDDDDAGGDGDGGEAVGYSRRKTQMKRTEAKRARPSLSYEEFFVSLYNYCTLTNETLIKFAFDVMDEDRSGTISRTELYDMVREVYQSDSDGARDQSKAIQIQVTKLMNVLDGDGDGDISFEEFERVHRKVGTIIYPAFKLQKKMQSKCMSSRFWNKATGIREKVCFDYKASLVEIFLDVREVSLMLLKERNEVRRH